MACPSVRRNESFCVGLSVVVVKALVAAWHGMALQLFGLLLGKRRDDGERGKRHERDLTSHAKNGRRDAGHGEHACRQKAKAAGERKEMAGRAVPEAVPLAHGIRRGSPCLLLSLAGHRAGGRTDPRRTSTGFFLSSSLSWPSWRRCASMP